HLYWRQLRDMKGSAVVESMPPARLTLYAAVCGWTLARAHARSGDPIAIAAYLGKSDKFDRSITDFSERYAVQNELDYQEFAKAMPIQLDFILRRLYALAEAQPDLRERQPWKAAHERDYAWLGAVVDKHYAGDESGVKVLAGGVLAAYDGMSVEDFEAQSEEFLRDTQHPTLGRGYLECAYAPMVELLGYLQENGFTNYIASGGGRDFMRPISWDVYRISRDRVIGTATTFTYTSGKGGGTITHDARADYLDDGPEKPVRIWSRTEIGR